MAEQGVEGRIADPVSAPERGADGGRVVLLLRLLWVVWLPFLAYPLTGFYRSYPISQLLHAQVTPLHRIASLAAAALFIAVYVWTTWRNSLDRAASPAPLPRMPSASWLPLAVLTAVPLVLILFDRHEWLTLFILTSAGVGARLPVRQAAWAVAGLVLLTAGIGGLTQLGWSTVGPTLFLVGFVGVVVISLVQVGTTNRELRAAREEIARLAVSEERLRFARDLHDLLGHNLSHIALKSEMAEALAPSAPERAMEAMREVAGVARTALAEMRAAVAGYRQPTLEAELRGAGEILAASGIAFQSEGGRVSVPPATEAVLAWAVREGVTNVVRHSRATRCTIRVGQEGGWVRVEIVDDGRGDGSATAVPMGATSGGNGLAGLGERVTAVGGRCGAEATPGGGFQLSVTVPAAVGARRRA
ncbi:MAG TPA: sensor histidine kinase [Chloroflexota bacterium]|nr:sensor histidine kinase [Chloroflexota bacterium]